MNIFLCASVFLPERFSPRCSCGNCFLGEYFSFQSVVQIWSFCLRVYCHFPFGAASRGLSRIFLPTFPYSVFMSEFLSELCFLFQFFFITNRALSQVYLHFVFFLRHFLVLLNFSFSLRLKAAGIAGDYRPCQIKGFAPVPKGTLEANYLRLFGKG